MTLSWLQIIRLGLVQACLGAIVVLMTSTLNRLMVVELSIAAIVPGLLVALHYAVQITRPKWGHMADKGGHRTRWIVGGMALLAAGGMGSAAAIPLLATHFGAGLALSVLCYAIIGLGVGASGTSLLALLAAATAPKRRPAAAMITWLMMIAGIALTAISVGSVLDPYSHTRLLWVVATVCFGALAVTALAVIGIERGLTPAQPQTARSNTPFAVALAEAWADPKARNFTIFVFLSMTAYFMQELILEPYAGLAFGYTPGESTRLSGAQNGGVFMGMLAVGLLSSGFGIGTPRTWVMLGCVGSAAILVTITLAAHLAAPFQILVMGLGLFNGIFAVAAISAMMQLAGEGGGQREGTRMGLWGASQAIAAGFGGLAGAALVDIARSFLAPNDAFGAVFSLQALLFLAAAVMAATIMGGSRRHQLVAGE